jgi:GIY-YIG catalytic domain
VTERSFDTRWIRNVAVGDAISNCGTRSSDRDDARQGKRPRMNELSIRTNSHHRVYLLLDQIGRVLYVGCTNNLRSRISHHKRAGEIPFVNCRSFGCEDWRKYQVEEKLIKRYKPSHNIRKSFIPIVPKEFVRLGVARGMSFAEIWSRTIDRTSPEEFYPPKPNAPMKRLGL